MSSSTQVPPQVDATLSRLTANKNVKGVMILRRPLGIILRTAGPLFPTSTSSTSSAGPSTTTPNAADTGGKDASQPSETSTGEEETHSTNDQLALSYARLGHNLVENVAEEVKAVDQDDNLRFLRVRTQKHEIMVTPDPEFILIVVQDPSA
ncbi:BZ3500_MvSof-1268-A1-R1_Chr2-1g04436 [Microbotryum saponariae]|uniref:BZ3500_MvSof-1268-A1-R1_Chr2-1g04436 protein n=1 Tax=Microbotryum saponariae TaxID=289078 RepID=A0A2X0KF38_9BASI|nr:BZ3500_MvSof-1268-A1-R1_Chr2-1g04436 [Microbotryum saponariae]SCZ91699.1 BZ3501_MvSof-1269-A2-R1_Chr2-1g04092 [Microbotryum saponariae]